jgi:thioesterase domain-containing protein
MTMDRREEDHPPKPLGHPDNADLPVRKPRPGGIAFLLAQDVLPALAEHFRANAVAKGFAIMPDMPEEANFNDAAGLYIETLWQIIENLTDATSIGLLAAEVSELLEARRFPDWRTRPSEHIPAFTAFEEEGADVFIRLLEPFERLGLSGRFAAAIQAKHAFNLTRVPRHGKLF